MTMEPILTVPPRSTRPAENSQSPITFSSHGRTGPSQELLVRAPSDEFGQNRGPYEGQRDQQATDYEAFESREHN